LSKKENKFPIFSAAFILFAIAVTVVFFYLYGTLLARLITEGLGEGGSLQKLLPVIATTAFIIIDTQIFLMISRFVISKYMESRGKKRQAKAILMLYTYVVWVLMSVILVTSIFRDVGAILTSLGLIGFGITFALQKPILNFVGWLTVVLTHPFTIGDRIEVQGIRGDVISIHTMYTRIQATRVDTLEKSEKMVTIPNEQILTNPVINYSRRGDVFWDDITMSITYESNWRKATEILQNVAETTSRKYLKNGIPVTQEEKQSWREAVGLLRGASKKLKKGILKEAVKEQIEIMKSAEIKSELEVPKPNVQMQFADSSINLNVLYATDLHSVRASKNEITKAFMEEVEKAKDIELAYPHMQIVYNPNQRAVRPGMPNLKKWENPEQMDDE
jgi:small-conductance mechanosensitive channel